MRIEGDELVIAKTAEALMQLSGSWLFSERERILHKIATADTPEQLLECKAEAKTLLRFEREMASLIKKGKQSEPSGTITH